MRSSAERALRYEPLYVAPAALALSLSPGPLAPFLLVLTLVPWFSLLRLGRRHAPTLFDLPLWLILAGTLLGYLVTLDQHYGLLRLWGVLAALGLFWAVCRNAQTSAARERWAAALAASAALGLLYVLSLIQGELSDGPVSRALDPALKLFSGFPRITLEQFEANERFIVNYNGVADLALVGILLSLPWLLSPSRLTATAKRLGLAAFVGVLAVLVIAAETRGGLLGLAAGGGVVLWLGSRRRWAAVALVTSAAIGLVVSGLFTEGTRLDSTIDRFLLWSNAVGVAADFPITGLGLGMRSAWLLLVEYGATPNPDTIVYAHNLWVQALLEQGALGFAGTLLLPVALLIALVRLARAHSPAALPTAELGAGAAACGLLVHGLTDQVTSTNVGFLLLLACLGVVAGAVQAIPGARPSPAEAPATAPKVALGGLGLVVLLALLSSHWVASSAYANLGAIQLQQAALSPDLSADQRRARLQAAETAFAQALEWEVDNVAARRQLAETLLRQNRLVEAVNTLGLAAVHPSASARDLKLVAATYQELDFSSHARFWRGRAFYLEGKLALARDEYQRAHQTDALNSIIFAAEADASAATGLALAGWNSYLSALALDPFDESSRRAARRQDELLIRQTLSGAPQR